jgi:hypothetical protein
LLVKHSKTIINHPYFDGYHPCVANRGWFTLALLTLVDDVVWVPWLVEKLPSANGRAGYVR